MLLTQRRLQVNDGDRDGGRDAAPTANTPRYGSQDAQTQRAMTSSGFRPRR